MEGGGEQAAPRTFTRSRCCCTDLPFALLFVCNLVALTWIFVFSVQSGEGFDGDIISTLQDFVNTSGANASITVGGFNLHETPLWQRFCEWLIAEFALVERDVEANWDLLLSLAALGTCLGLGWLQLLKRATNCVVHLTLLLVVVVVVLLGFVLFHYSRGCLVALGSVASGSIECVVLHPLTATESSVLKWASYIVWGVGGLILLSIVALRAKIALTVVIFEEACRGCLHNLGIYPVTLFVATIVVAFHVFWAYTWMYLFTVPGDSVLTHPWIEEASMSVRWTLFYMLFGYWWTCAFLHGLFHTCVSGIVGNWYFEKKQQRSAVGNMCTMMTRCMGSLATGSFLIGVLSLLRYLTKKAAKLGQKRPVIGGMFKCCSCCLWFVSKAVEVVNKYAYVYVAMEHSSFCNSARKSFKLIAKYPVQLVVMRSINGFVLLCGKLLLTTSCMLCLLFALEELQREFCVVFLLLVTLATFQVFRFQANIIAAAADTIFVCYAMDLDLNGAAVHLKPSHRLHAKVKLAVEQYERDYPGQVPVLSASAAGTSSSSSSKFELELQPEGGGKVTDAQRLQDLLKEQEEEEARP